MAILKFGTETTTIVLKGGTGFEADGDYGKQWKWGCNEDDIFYATESLNALLGQLSVKGGDTVNIKKVKKLDDDGNTLMTKDGQPVMVFQVGEHTLESLTKHNETSNTPLPSPTTPNVTHNKPSVEERLAKIEGELHITYTNVVETSDAEIPF
jgi:hypothetical protein